MDYLLKYIKNNYQFSALDTMVLLDKPYRREKPIDITYTGFQIKDEFVYGYGLDLKDYQRNITDIMYVM
jgi:hypoxanthine-guanine phosphoribosyltransferase